MEKYVNINKWIKNAPDRYPSLRGARERVRFWSQWRRLTWRKAQISGRGQDSGSAKEIGSVLAETS